MLIVNLLFLSLQVNSWFPIYDVKHILVPRILKLKLNAHVYGDVEGYGRIVPTRAPEHAVVSANDNRMHFFLHDTTCVRHCLWDGKVSFKDKKEIVTSLVEWLDSVNISTSHYLYDHEDGTVFAEVTNELSSFD